jgi:hypothetical protein
MGLKAQGRMKKRENFGAGFGWGYGDVDLMLVLSASLSILREMIYVGAGWKKAVVMKIRCATGMAVTL